MLQGMKDTPWDFCNNLLQGEEVISYLFSQDLIQAMKYELYLTKLKRGYDFNWDYFVKTGSTTLAHPPGEPGTGGEIISVALIDGD